MERAWLHSLPLIAILRGLPTQEAVAIGTALVGSGFRILEVPLNSPTPLQSIRALADAFEDRCLIGAGTVMTTQEVDAVAGAGGKLIVMPHGDAAVIAAARQRGLKCIPGAATPTEALASWRAGADAIKVFPAEQIGPRVLAAWRAVLPAEIDLLPVGGITPEGMAEFVRAGATGFGLGSALYRPGRSAAEVGDAAQHFLSAWSSLRHGPARS